ncbi:Conserved TM helix [Pyrobaculum oguniense TE7]|uniref:Conserved TM helix n=1 Tax=Pyrobaculum oguniense (strain DSM 13380 / JCM 10595 / TE7) TaxID=698757 RepID=H6Q9A5_PYROT|nr:Conserved TM helix [Pyrobaculum oguniense TE7]
MQLQIDLGRLIQDIIQYGIQGLIAIIIVLIAWLLGSVVGRAVNRLIERTGLEKAFDKTDVGKAFRSAGIDLSNLIGMLVTAFIVVIGIVIALGYLRIGGEAGALIADVARYLPRLIGGIILNNCGCYTSGPTHRLYREAPHGAVPQAVRGDRGNAPQLTAYWPHRACRVAGA